MPYSGEQCDRVLECIEPYIDAELRGEELEGFERHIASCERCREELARATTLASELRALPPHRCPDRVLEEAARRAGAHAGGIAETRFERLRKRFGGRFHIVPNPAVAVGLIVIVVAMLAVLNHDRTPGTRTGDRSAELAVSEQELEAAKQDVVLAFSYVAKYTRRAGEIVKQDGLTGRVMKTIRESVVKPMLPFPIRK